MSAYRYYENEAARHAEAKAIVLTETRARELCDYLCDKATKDGIDGGYPFNPLKAVEMHKKNVGFSGTTVERVELRVSDRAHSWSWYRHHDRKTGKPYIYMARGMLNLSFVCHEWAHHASRRIYRLYEYGVQHTAEGHFVYGRRPPPSYKYHDYHHAVLTDWAIAEGKKWLKMQELLADAVADPFLSEHPYVQNLKKAACPNPTPVEAPKPEVLPTVEAFFNSLPAMLHCPHCDLDKPKADFGVRVMKKDASGNPLKLARQSRCKLCR